MVKVPFEVMEKINNFIKLLESNNIKIQKAILFGSYSKGTYNKWSDIDLALVSENFTGNSFEDKVNLIDYIYLAGKDISPLTYRPDDFENNYFVRDEILKEGIIIK